MKFFLQSKRNVIRNLAMKPFLHARKRSLKFILLAIFAAVQSLQSVCATALYACPGCKEGFDKGTEQAGVGAAYSLTICFMILMPVVIIGTIVYKVRAQIKAHTAHAERLPA
jgi:hypothetical protein